MGRILNTVYCVNIYDGKYLSLVVIYHLNCSTFQWIMINGAFTSVSNDVNDVVKALTKMIQSYMFHLCSGGRLKHHLLIHSSMSWE